MEKRTTTDEILIHHSDSNRLTTTREQIDSWHRANGWDGIGYHKVIDGHGVVKQGRPDEMKGAHCPDHNWRSLGVCLTGKFLKGHDVLVPDKKTDGQYAALIWTLAELCKRWKIKPEAIRGHCDCYTTACPGTVHALLPRIRDDVRKYL